MKSLTQYLQESKQTYNFKLKLAKELSNEELDRVERHLLKYDVEKFSAPKKTMIQNNPIDFPGLRGHEIYIVDFSTARPASAYIIQTELVNLLGIGENLMKVRGENEPNEEVKEDENVESLLEDPEYKDAEKVNSEEYYGDKYNTSFVQELLKLRKNKEKDSE